MNKIKIVLISITLSPIIAGAFGILHDQVTYSISEEYFTKFKFIQFHISETIINTPRLAACIVGFGATWWVGLFIGIIFTICFLSYKTNELLLRHYFKAIAITFVITIIFSLIGFIYGSYFLSVNEVNWYFPDNLIDKINFITVGSIHNSSYLGGLTGLTVGVIYLLKNNGRSKKHNFPKIKSIKESL